MIPPSFSQITFKGSFHLSIMGLDPFHFRFLDGVPCHLFCLFNGCGSKKWNKDQNNRNPSCFTLSHTQMGMGQKKTTRGPQVLVLVSICQVPCWVFLTRAHFWGPPRRPKNIRLDVVEGLMHQHRELRVSGPPEAPISRVAQGTSLGRASVGRASFSGYHVDPLLKTEVFAAESQVFRT